MVETAQIGPAKTSSARNDKRSARFSNGDANDGTERSGGAGRELGQYAAVLVFFVAFMVFYSPQNCSLVRRSLTGNTSRVRETLPAIADRLDGFLALWCSQR